MNLAAFLGLGREGPGHPIVLRDPVLPDPLERLRLKNLAFPEGELSFEIRKVAETGGKGPQFQVEKPKTTGSLKCVVVRS
jgi:hypothetical protein